MSEVKQHGRRRSVPSSTEPLVSVALSRREMLAAERSIQARRGSLGNVIRSGITHGASQKAGIALAATGLALAVIVPSAGGVTLPGVSAGVDTPMAASVAQTLVTAAPDASIAFDAPSIASKLNPDGKLKETLRVKASNVTPQAAKGTLSAPLKTLVPSSPFGSRLNPLTGAMGEMHTGQDYAIQCSTAVFAAAGGTVTFAGWHPYGGGNRVVIDHGNGLSTSYNHLSSIGVKVGQKIQRGEQVALSGTTGASTGCHLHFEVIVDDETVDPLGWL